MHSPIQHAPAPWSTEKRLSCLPIHLFFPAHPLPYHSLQIERLKRTTTRLVPCHNELHRSNFDQVTITYGKGYSVGRL